ncbi:ABC transporter permease [candidate division KSB1 bacterium]|nr:ABC transporter permease [candidate division KSB1 bacterium]
MFINYLKITLRNLVRQKGLAFINIAGLAVGMACFILIALWVFDELSYDQFHEKKDRIFRVNTISPDFGMVTTSSLRLGPTMKQAYPEIENYTRIVPWARSLVKYKDKVFDEWNIALVDSGFFSIFTFPFIEGEPKDALTDRYSIVITKATAERYFDSEDPIGKMVYSRAFDRNFKVTGVIKNIPKNSTMQFNIAARIDLMPQQRLDSWEFTGYTMLLLSENIQQHDFNRKIAGFYSQYADSTWKSVPVLQEVTKIHLYADGTPGLIKLVYIFAIIAVFILLIACVNFMNLSTARAARYAKQVAVRKVVGAARRQLICQFLGESILVALVSLLMALLIVQIALPAFNSITNKDIALFSSNMKMMLLFLIGVALFTGTIAGSYPSLFLSSFQPVKILKENRIPETRSQIFRKGLTIFQFAISIILISSILVMRDQLRYLQTKDIGINREFVVRIANNQDLNEKFDSYKYELLKNPSIVSLTSTQNQPIDVENYIGVNWEGHFNAPELPMAYSTVGYDFFKTFDMKLIQGRPFTKEFPTDATEACIINETALKLMQLDSPLGKTVYFNHPAFPESLKYVHIIGVAKDHHFRSLHEAIGPFIMRMYPPYQFFVYFKLKPENINATIEYIKKVTHQFAPDFPFYVAFLDDTYNQLYEIETRMEKIYQVFAFLAIFISCLGLLGLASFTIEQRTKEIGLRKVLGASMTGIIQLLTKELIRWIIIANIIALPIAYFAMKAWLQNFAYRVTIDWRMFILAGLLALVIALVTVSFQSIKAALANPIDSLRYE